MLERVRTFFTLEDELGLTDPEAEPLPPAAIPPPFPPPWARRAFRRLRAGFPLTGGGLCVLAGAGALWTLAWHREQDYVLCMVARVGFALVAMLLGGVVLSALLLARRLKSARTPEGLRLETDAWQPTGFRVAVPRWLPCLEVRWDIVDDEGRPLPVDVEASRENGFLAEQMHPRRRGLHRLLCRRFRVRDVLGVAGVDLEASEPGHVRIVPARSGLESLPTLVALLASDEVSDPRGEPFGDRVDMRQYARGDPPRLIMWKIFARTRKLMVRVPERAITAQPRTCAWFFRGPRDEAAAALCRVVLERGLLGEGWRFGADAPARPDAGDPGSPEGRASHLEEALDLLARSGNGDPDRVPPAPPAAFSAFLERAERDGYVCCLVFAPPGDGPWIATVEGAARRTRMRVHAFMGVETMHAPEPPTHWQRLFTVPRPPSGTPSREEMGRAFDRWRKATGGTFAIERETGRVWDGLPPLQPAGPSRRWPRP